MQNRKIVLFIFLTIFLFSFYLLTVYINNSSKDTSVNYPSLYRKKPLSLAVTESDSRFVINIKNKNQSILANVKSSLIDTEDKEPSYKIEKGQLENGTWLWTPISLLTESYTKEILKGARENNINKIYLAVDSYLDIYVKNDSPEKTAEKKEFDEKISKFIKSANLQNIKVVAVCGWKNWTRKEHSYKSFIIMDYVIDFNSKRQEKFDGLQFDIEPYLLDEYKENKKEILKEFLALFENIFDNSPKEGLPISVVVPEFFDKSSNLTPKFFWNGRYDFTINHLVKIMKTRKDSSLLVMAYRNFNTGYDGVFDISKDEIKAGNKHNVKTIIAVETGDFMPPFITYYNTNKRYYNQNTSEILEYYKNEPSFSGIATHYINSLMEMR